MTSEQHETTEYGRMDDVRTREDEVRTRGDEVRTRGDEVMESREGEMLHNTAMVRPPL